MHSFRRVGPRKPVGSTYRAMKLGSRTKTTTSVAILSTASSVRLLFREDEVSAKSGHLYRAIAQRKAFGFDVASQPPLVGVYVQPTVERGVPWLRNYEVRIRPKKSLFPIATPCARRIAYAAVQ